MFCPNCGTENDEAATTCKKCGFNLKGAAAPKFKGTMLMMNAPGTVPRAAGQPPGTPGAGAPPVPSPGGIPAPAPRQQLKGTMLGVAPPGVGNPLPPAPVPPPAFGSSPSAPPPPPVGFGAPPPGFGAPPPAAPPRDSAVNPLGGTMVADQSAFRPPAGASSGGGFPPPGVHGQGPSGNVPGPGAGPAPGQFAPPGQPGGYGPPPGPAGGYGPPPGAPFGAPPHGPGGNAGGPPPAGGFGAPPAFAQPNPGGFGAGASPFPGPTPGYAAPGGASEQHGFPGAGGGTSALSPAPGFGGPPAGPYPGHLVSSAAHSPSGYGTRPVGNVRNPVMVLVLGSLCFIYAALQLWQTTSELKAFRQKQDLQPVFFLIPVLNLIEMWRLPEKVLDAKRMAGIANPTVPHPVLYLFLWLYFLPNDLNEIWQTVSSNPRPSLPAA